MAAAKMRLHSVTLRSGRPMQLANARGTSRPPPRAIVAEHCNAALLPCPAHRASGRSRATPSSGSDGPAPRTCRTSSSYPPFREEETEPGIWSGAAGSRRGRAREIWRRTSRPSWVSRTSTRRPSPDGAINDGDRTIVRHAGTLHSHVLLRRPRTPLARRSTDVSGPCQRAQSSHSRVVPVAWVGSLAHLVPGTCTERGSIRVASSGKGNLNGSAAIQIHPRRPTTFVGILRPRPTTKHFCKVRDKISDRQLWLSRGFGNLGRLDDVTLYLNIDARSANERYGLLLDVVRVFGNENPSLVKCPSSSNPHRRPSGRIGPLLGSSARAQVPPRRSLAPRRLCESLGPTAVSSAADPPCVPHRDAVVRESLTVPSSSVSVPRRLSSFRTEKVERGWKTPTATTTMTTTSNASFTSPASRSVEKPRRFVLPSASRSRRVPRSRDARHPAKEPPVSSLQHPSTNQANRARRLRLRRLRLRWIDTRMRTFQTSRMR
jgi:hypothetical protein